MRERGRPLGAAPQQQVAVAHAGDELECRSPPSCSWAAASSSVASSVEIWPAVKSRITWSSIVTRLQRTAQSSGAQFDSLGGRLQRCPAGEVSPAGRSPAGSCWPRPSRRAATAGVWQARPTTPAAANGVHGRGMGRLQRRLAAERVLRLVGRTVGDDDGVFHCAMLYRCSRTWRQPVRMLNLAPACGPSVLGRIEWHRFPGRPRLAAPSVRFVGHDHQRHRLGVACRRPRAG